MRYLLRRLGIIVLATLTLLPVQAPLLATQNDPLVLGVFPRRNATETNKLFTPLCEYLSQQLGRKVLLDTSPDFKSFWRKVDQGEFDVVHYNHYQYVRSHKERGYEVILKNAELGKTTLTGALAVRTDSGIDTLQDLRGKTIVFGGGPRAMIAYLVPKHMLIQAQLDQADYVTKFANSPLNALLSVNYRQADAAGVGDLLLKLPKIQQKLDTSQFKYIITGEQLVHIPWAVHPRLSPQLRSTIQDILSQLNNHEHGKRVLQSARLNALVIAADHEYDQCRRIIFEVLNEQY